MIGITLRRPPTSLLLLLPLLLLVAASGCTAETKEIAETIAQPSPSPSPAPTPVEGTLELDTVVSGRPQLLGFSELPATDADAVQASANAVRTTLDTFLEGAQRGEPDLLVLRGAWLAEADPGAAEVLTTGVTHPDNPVSAATYRVTMHVEPAPVVAAVAVTVQRRDGTNAGIELVFDVTEQQPRLQLVAGTGAS